MKAVDVLTIFQQCSEQGWVLEPETMQIMAGHGLTVVEHCRARNLSEALACGLKVGFPLVVKVVSPAIMHKSDVHGVAVGVNSKEELAEHFANFSMMEGFSGMLVAKMIFGVELILGGKIDRHFGPVVMLGIGGTGVEIYGDVVIRMIPLGRDDVPAMVDGLQGHRLLKGFRQGPAVNMEMLTSTVLAFSAFVMKYQDQIASVEINPLICSAKECVTADARIILRDRK